MRDELATVLRLVADGKLPPDEAAPIIEALSAHDRPATPRGAVPESSAAGRATGSEPRSGGQSRGRRVRIQVKERGRRVVDVRIPLSFAAVAARIVPGIPDSYASLIEKAVETDTIGPIVDAEDENGDGVLITME